MKPQESETTNNMNTQEEHKSMLEEVLAKENELILHNDDFNTFDHVIDCLIAICDHSVEQAEQCTYLVHYKGKCAVKRGSFDKLIPMKEALQDQKLTVEIK